MAKYSDVTIIPAQPGYKVIYEVDYGNIFAANDVIAWRIYTTHSVELLSEQDSTTLFSEIMPITTEGEAAENCIGTLTPDGRAIIFEDGEWDTLAGCRSDRIDRL